MAPQVWVETEITVAKCQKMGHAEAIPTGVVYFQRYNCLFLSVAYVLTEKSAMLTLKTNLAAYCQKSPIGLLRIGSLFEACSPNSGLGNAQKSLGTAVLTILA